MVKRGLVAFLVFALIVLFFLIRVGSGSANKPILEKAVSSSLVCTVGDYRANMKDSEQKDFIIANHGDLLSHAGIIPSKPKSVRDRVVRMGDRSSRGFASCVECHRSRANFCDKCHDYVGVSSVSDKTGCFACHFYPDNASEWGKWKAKMEAIK